MEDGPPRKEVFVMYKFEYPGISLSELTRANIVLAASSDERIIATCDLQKNVVLWMKVNNMYFKMPETTTLLKDESLSNARDTARAILGHFLNEESETRFGNAKLPLGHFFNNGDAIPQNVLKHIQNVLPELTEAYGPLHYHEKNVFFSISNQEISVLVGRGSHGHYEASLFIFNIEGELREVKKGFFDTKNDRLVFNETPYKK